MPYSTKEKQKEHDKGRKEYFQDYFREHKEEIKDRQRCRYAKNRESIKAKARVYVRNHVLVTRSKTVCGVYKRPYTGYCELCNREMNEQVNKLHYHHWDDSDLEKGKYVKGMWLCHRCHRLCEHWEKEGFYLIERYERLKKFINKQHRIQERLKPEQN